MPWAGRSCNRCGGTIERCAFCEQEGCGDHALLPLRSDRPRPRGPSPSWPRRLSGGFRLVALVHEAAPGSHGGNHLPSDGRGSHSHSLLIPPEGRCVHAHSGERRSVVPAQQLSHGQGGCETRPSSPKSSRPLGEVDDGGEDELDRGDCSVGEGGHGPKSLHPLVAGHQWQDQVAAAARTGLESGIATSHTARP